MEAESNSKNTEGGDVFCKPTLPAFAVPTLNAAAAASTSSSSTSKPVSTSKLKEQEVQKHDYVEPAWSAIPNTNDKYYFECIKSGTQLDDIDLTKQSYYSIGRYFTCDIMLEHPSLSRFHAIIQYSNGELDVDYPKGFYLYDMSSTHGTIVNKKRVEAKKYVYLKIGSCLKFGGSTRLFILHGPELPNADDLNINLTHEQMKKLREKQNQLALKLRIRKEAEAEHEQNENEEDADIDWGIKDDDAAAAAASAKPTSGDAAILTNVAFNTETNGLDDSFYASDPRKALKIFFEREGEDLVYDCEELGYSRFKCRIRLPIDNDVGEPMYAEVASFEGKKKECQAQCALEACRILDSVGILRQSNSAYKRKRLEKDWETNDYYDSDDDTYLDRTGDVEKKRIKRISKFGSGASEEAKSGSKVHTFESLKEDFKRLNEELIDINARLEKCKNIVAAVQNDDVDAYISFLKQRDNDKLDTVARTKLKRRIVDINQEMIKLDKLLNMAKPPCGFDLPKWKTDVVSELKNARLNKASQQEDEKKKQIESRISAASASKRVDEVKEEPKKEVTNDEVKQQQPPQDIEKIVKKKLAESSPAVIRTTSVTAPSNKRAAVVVNKEDDMDYDKFVNDKDYSMWLPPEDQSGDGKTKLNAKFGY